jgi:hypothetical protein
MTIRTPIFVLALGLLAPVACTPPGPAAPVQAAPSANASASAQASAAPKAARPSIVEQMALDAKRLSEIVQTDGAKLFLSRASLLPKITTFPLYRDADKSHYYTEAEAKALPAEARAALQPFPATEEIYYYTGYGSPLSYSRPLDILFSRGVRLRPGSKLLDFGYGYIGHLRMLASMGVTATGVDVHPLLRALYSAPGDQGPIAGPNGEKGAVRLIDGFFPSDPKIVQTVGNGYDLVISKNTLKRGYIHPDRPADEKKLVHLGVSDEVAIKAFFDALAPGGHFMIYNICPALSPPDKPFVPWSDGRSPWSRAQWEAAGFEVLVFDQDDTPAVRVMGHALAWDQPDGDDPGMDLVNDLSVLYTLVRKP